MPKSNKDNKFKMIKNIYIPARKVMSPFKYKSIT